ncbi:MAG: hypothetical protein ACYDGM_13880 [Vulcanimicrobiaceae bacterium]
MKRLTLCALSAVMLYAVSAVTPAFASTGLPGEYTCLTYGASIRWFQNLVFHPDGAYSLGSTAKPYDAGRYTMGSNNIVHFLSGGDANFLGLYKGGNVFLKFKTDKGPFEKKGFDLTFKCGRNSKQP